VGRCTALIHIVSDMVNELLLCVYDLIVSQELGVETGDVHAAFSECSYQYKYLGGEDISE
jgi:hypothetical protein